MQVFDVQILLFAYCMLKKHEKIPSITEVIVDQVKPMRILPWYESVTFVYIGVRDYTLS